MPEASALLAAAEQARCCRRRPQVHQHLLLHVLLLPGAQIRVQPPQPQRLPPRLCESRCCCVCHQSQVPGRALQRTTWRCAACMGAASSLHIKHIIGGEHSLVVSRRTLSPISSLIRHACVAALGTSSSLARISHLHAVLCRSCAAWRTAAATNAQQTAVTAPALRHADRSHRILCAVIPIIALLPLQSMSGPYVRANAAAHLRRRAVNVVNVAYEVPRSVVVCNPSIPLLPTPDPHASV